MDKFESQFSDLDVQTSYMESTMSDTTALTTPQDQVDTLISQVADENGLEISQKVGQGNVPASTPTPVASVQEREGGLEEDGKLAERLRALRVSPSGPALLTSLRSRGEQLGAWLEYGDRVGCFFILTLGTYSENNGIWKNSRRQRNGPRRCV
jgi:hypothetical protein